MQPYREDEDERPDGPLDSAEALLEEGRRYQRESGVAPPFWGRKPSLWPWTVLAVVLIVISIGIELFWPLPGRHGPLPACTGQSFEAVSCQRPASPSLSH